MEVIVFLFHTPFQLKPLKQWVSHISIFSD